MTCITSQSRWAYYTQISWVDTNNKNKSYQVVATGALYILMGRLLRSIMSPMSSMKLWRVPEHSIWHDFLFHVNESLTIPAWSTCITSQSRWVYHTQIRWRDAYHKYKSRLCCGYLAALHNKSWDDELIDYNPCVGHCYCNGGPNCI